jgi:hypothetical protein
MAEAANQSLTDPGPIPGPITLVMLLRFNGIGERRKQRHRPIKPCKLRRCELR